MFDFFSPSHILPLAVMTPTLAVKNNWVPFELPGEHSFKALYRAV
jgi:hypothetical protein